ncbi:hypothetical protein SAMN05444406_11744 [Caldicoprobacter faecalis]|uniref:Uncharacterized protein n=2 Tax=Caldicoprobacter faecalis TaxID=937334 RepID=A0A1I5WKN5_9FIRM|nr:hypothetical protein SAMN05444406_11744 [Caldicoprobacter faecalis]
MQFLFYLDTQTEVIAWFDWQGNLMPIKFRYLTEDECYVRIKIELKSVLTDLEERRCLGTGARPITATYCIRFDFGKYRYREEVGCA